MKNDNWVDLGISVAGVAFGLAWWALIVWSVYAFVVAL